jgi:hypothetical protein
MNIQGRRILIAGSAEFDAHEEVLSWVHALVQELVVTLAQKGASFVVPFGKDPKVKHGDVGPSVIFDWTVAEALFGVLTNGATQPTGGSGRLIATIATAKTDVQIPSHRRNTYDELRKMGAVSMEFLDPGWASGAIRRSRQAQLADVLIAISGGEGVEHLAQEFARRGKHVIPLDINLGSSGSDGSGGSAKLFGEALKRPDLFFRVKSPNSGAELLDRTRTSNGTAVHTQTALAIINLIEQLTAPRVFYVRLLNKDHSDYPQVEQFFREIVDPVVKELGLELHQMGMGVNEFAWMNDAIFQSLHHSEVVLVDLTGVRPNCFMELGYALGNTQRVIVTARKGTELPFDPSCLETYMWDPSTPIDQRQRELKDHWARNINMPPLVREGGLR